jgi:Immune inhibitor A peptidase M6
MMEYLEGQFGQAFMTALHNEDRNGLDGLQGVLDQFVTGRTAQEVVHDYLAAVAVDNALDDGKARGGAAGARYTIPTLAAAINLDSTESYSSPGSPPNGADYVRLRDAAGNYLSGRHITSLAFSGERTFAPDPVAWKAVGGVLSADLTTDLLNNTIVREITVPAANPTLTFRGKYDLEAHWDYGFVQISTDDGETYTSLPCSNTASDNVPNAHPLVLQYVPGYSGQSDWRVESCNLSAYAGQTVLLAFRGVTDWGTIGNDADTANDGWFIDDVTVGGTIVSDGSTLDGWRSETQVNPVEVAGFTIQLVGYSADKKQVIVSRVPVGADLTADLSRGALQRLVGNHTDVVAALVSFDEPTEAVEKYAQYQLRVNGTLQPGG